MEFLVKLDSVFIGFSRHRLNARDISIKFLTNSLLGGAVIHLWVGLFSSIYSLAYRWLFLPNPIVVLNWLSNWDYYLSPWLNLENPFQICSLFLVNLFSNHNVDLEPCSQLTPISLNVVDVGIFVFIHKHYENTSYIILLLLLL